MLITTAINQNTVKEREFFNARHRVVVEWMPLNAQLEILSIP